MQKIIKGYTTYQEIKHLPIGTIVSLSSTIQKKFCSLKNQAVENGFFRYMGEIYIDDQKYYLFYNEEKRTFFEYETYLAIDVLEIEQIHEDNFKELFKEKMPEMFEECMIIVEPLMEHLDKTIEAACMINLAILNEVSEENLEEHTEAILMKNIIKETNKLKIIINKE
jgi:hypothetical protein